MKLFQSRLNRKNSACGTRAVSALFRAAPQLRAFTMIEIAISLAVVGFALAAIMGVLPLGMGVQKQNREETIINQDGQVWMDVIRNGTRGFDDLTNYVIAITNSVIGYNNRGLPTGFKATYGYTLSNSTTPNQFPLISGLRIMGLISTPTYIFDSAGGYLSNRVTVYMRSMSGAASEKFPQTNPDVRDLAFTYRLAPEVVVYWTNYVDPAWQIYPGYPAGSSNAIAWTNYMNTLATMQMNLHDVRLNFRWPLLARSAPGPGQQSFRAIVGGTLVETNEPTFPRPNPSVPSAYDLYFFQPRTYAKP